MSMLKDILPSLKQYTNLLKSLNGEKIEIVNQVILKRHTLLSLSEFNDPEIIKHNPIPINLFFEHFLIPKAEEEYFNQKEFKLEEIFLEFKSKIIDQLDAIRKIITSLWHEIEKNKPSSFIFDFSNGVLMDPDVFITSLQRVISYMNLDSYTEITQQNRIQHIFNSQEPSFEDLEKRLNIELELLGLLQYDFPTTIEEFDQAIVNQGKRIPYINGIDIHPKKNIYIAITCENGDLVLRNQDMNFEIKQIHIKQNTSRGVQNCLWSPSGNKILVSTKENNFIFIYDEVGDNLLNFIQCTHTSNSLGAIWLSDEKIAVGYEDGIIKIFNLK